MIAPSWLTSHFIQAAAEKEEGNALFKEGKWVDAMRKYAEAIKRDPNNPETTHIYYSNRGNCYIRMNEMNLAIEVGRGVRGEGAVDGEDKG